MLVRVRPGAPIISSTYSGISRTAGGHSCRLAKVVAKAGSAGALLKSTSKPRSCLSSACSMIRIKDLGGLQAKIPSPLGS